MTDDGPVMSLLSRSPRPPTSPSTVDASTDAAAADGVLAPLRSPVALGALSAVQAVAGSLLCVVAPVVVAWLAASRTGASWLEAVRFATDAWLLAHGGAIAVDGGEVSLVPLGLTALMASWSWAAGRRMAALLPAGPHPRRVSGCRALAAYAAVYAFGAALLSLLAASPVARPVSGQALVGAAVLAGAACGAGMLRATRTAADRPAGRVLADALRLPARVRRVLPAVGVALAGWLALGALAVAVAVVHGWSDVLAVHRALSPGVVGGAVLAVTQLLVLPVSVVWGGAWVAGPGFAVGTGTTVTVVGSDLGSVPAVPLLAALPGPSLPGAWLAVLGLPVLLGVAAGVVARRSAAGAAASGWGGRGWAGRLLDALGVGALTGTGAGLLAWAASGAAGPGRMAETGPPALAVGAALGALVALGVLLAGLLPGTVDEPGTRLPGADLLARQPVVRWAVRRWVPLRRRIGAGAAAVHPAGVGRRVRSRIRRS